MSWKPRKDEESVKPDITKKIWSLNAILYVVLDPGTKEKDIIILSAKIWMKSVIYLTHFINANFLDLINIL